MTHLSCLGVVYLVIAGAVAAHWLENRLIWRWSRDAIAHGVLGCTHIVLDLATRVIPSLHGM